MNKNHWIYITIGVLLIPVSVWIYNQTLWKSLGNTAEYPVTVFVSDSLYGNEINTSLQTLKTVPGTLKRPSVSVAVGIDGEVIWSAAAGYANLDRQIPATPSTAYRIGSTSKAVTSTALMLLANRGELDIDKPANHYIPQLPEDRPPVTTRQLLSHTAGFGNYGDFGLKSAFFTICNCVQFHSVDESLNLFIKSPLLFKPGTDFAYSSFDVIAASKVIESVSGKYYLQFLKDHLFNPLEMQHSYADHGPWQAAEPAVFYEISDLSYRKWRTLNISSHETNLSYKWAGGGLLSTPSDLVKMGNALVADSNFISFKTRDDFFTPQRLTNGEVNEQQYAVGWRSYYTYASDSLLGKEKPVWMVHHGGVSKGSMNMFALFPDYRLVINISVNGREEDINFTPFWFTAMTLVQPFIERLHHEKSK